MTAGGRQPIPDAVILWPSGYPKPFCSFSVIPATTEAVEVNRTIVLSPQAVNIGSAVLRA
jgi:hypothetical protein